MEIDKFQGIFDQGFSGILQESSRKTMPDYIEKLAEQEIDYEPPVVEVPNILFESNLSLSRANDVSSDKSRDTNVYNRFSAEKNQKIAGNENIEKIDREVQKLVKENNDFEKIYSSLLGNKSFDKEVVFKYLEAKVKLGLDKFAFLGFETINEKQANVIEQSRNDFKIRRSTVHEILDKFAKLEYISNSVIKQYKELLSSKRPVFVASKFLFSLNDIKRKYYEEKEASSTFKRDGDFNGLSIRDLENNTKRSNIIEKEKIFASMLDFFKQGIFERLSASEVNKKLAKTFGFDKFQDFYDVYKDEMKRIEHFGNRQAFDTNFASSALQGVEIIPEAKPVEIDSKAMMNYSFDLMTSGNDLETVCSSLKKKFGIEASNQFLTENDYKLQKNYGQLGYLFIDSNIYANCDEMAKKFSNLQHSGSNLIYSIKANSRCVGCNLNKCGTCSKVNLAISNNPIVRSSRAAKRVFDKAASFVPKTYIDEFSNQISESNLELISKFSLGIKAALEDEKKNIGKRASKNRSETTELQESFVEVVANFDADMSPKQRNFGLIDEILNESVTASVETKDKDYESNLKKAIDNLSYTKKMIRKRFLALPDDVLTIRSAKQLAKEYKVKYQDILKTLTPSRNIDDAKYWDADGNIVGRGIG